MDTSTLITMFIIPMLGYFMLYVKKKFDSLDGNHLKSINERLDSIDKRLSKLEEE